MTDWTPVEIQPAQPGDYLAATISRRPSRDLLDGWDVRFMDREMVYWDGSAWTCTSNAGAFTFSHWRPEAK